MATLQGGDELKARLKAIQQSFKPIGRKWADTAVEIAPPKMPVRPSSMHAGDKHAPGRLRASVRRKRATQFKATVAAHYTTYFIDAGVKPHSMSKRVKGEDRTAFAKKHPGYRARPFRGYIAHESLRRHPMAETVIDEWNRAAGRRV